MYCSYCGEEHPYCIWCGENLRGAHNLECPLVYGIKVVNGGFIAFGEAVTGDSDVDMNTARMGCLLLCLNEGKLGSKDKEVNMRMAFESFSFLLIRFDTELTYLRDKRCITRWGEKRKAKKIKKLQEERRKLKEFPLMWRDSLSPESQEYWKDRIEERYLRKRYPIRYKTVTIYKEEVND